MSKANYVIVGKKRGHAENATATQCKKGGIASTSTYKTLNANSTGKMFSLSLVCLKILEFHNTFRQHCIYLGRGGGPLLKKSQVEVQRVRKKLRGKLVLQGVHCAQESVLYVLCAVALVIVIVIFDNVSKIF